MLAVGIAVGIYFALQPYVGTEEIGWMCILGAAPFAACGFFTYHGMTAEQVLWAWVKSEILCPKRLVSATSDTHINALDMDRAYGDERNPIVSKSEFVLSLFEQLIGDGMVTAKEKSILGRCTEQVYLPYIRNGYKGTPPTLQDFYRLLQMQPEPEAQGLALSSELFITGTLNTFARHTNVDTQARIIAYDIRELGEQLMPLGMLVTLDAIYNRVIQNWKKGRRTWIFCDEFYRARRSVT